MHENEVDYSEKKQRSIANRDAPLQIKENAV